MLKAIIFDCFGVLTTDTWNAFLDSLPDGIDINAARDVHRTYNAGLLTKTESADQIRKITGQTFVELEDMHYEIIKNDALLTYIRELKNSYKIGLLSNIGNNWIRDDFLSADEQALFDEMVFSYEVGMNKPDPRIFELAAQRLGVNPEEAIMVDDKSYYCTAAQGIGMQAIVYNDASQLKADLKAILSR